ncbi:LLM class flavin-dependent oxidoreductase [Streptomyces sp. SID8377]|nr:LLM class flavin-dependent oxidoreductase [Streptomyces sp. SID8377]
MRTGLGVPPRRALAGGEGRVLLLRHRLWPEGRQWGLPTGYAKAGEDFRDTVAREVREETGLDVEAGEVVHLKSGYKRGPARTVLRPGEMSATARRSGNQSLPTNAGHWVKKIGFLSFGHWSPSEHSRARSAADVLRQSIDLAVAAEEIGVDGAYFRVHHFARQAASPFPLLAAIGARTSKIEIGTGVIDMRYENPLYMAEDAGAADLISGGRLQLGVSRGSPEQVIDGWRLFGYEPAPGESAADMARRHTEALLKVLDGEGFAQPNPRPMFPNPPGLLRIEPHSEGLRDRIWWGSASNATAVWAAELGMNLQSSTLKDDETGEPLHVQQRKQIEAYREAYKKAGHTREPRVSVSRSIFALTNDLDRAYFGRDRNSRDQVGMIDDTTRAVFGRSYAAEPEELVQLLRDDEAIQAADTLLLTIPNQLGVDYNTHVLESILTHVAPELGWR